MKQIVGILLVKNEDLHIEWVIRNIFDFCDYIIVLDNDSTDDTYSIVKRLSTETNKIDLRKWKNSRTSQIVLSPYYGTDTWVFGVDGDEIHAPKDLAALRKRIFKGEFDRVWELRGIFLNCTQLDLYTQTAHGYPGPPAGARVKLYNFQLISGWKDSAHRERLHGYPIFAEVQSEVILHTFVGSMSSWNDSHLRCLHLCFIPRSSQRKFKQRFRLKHQIRRLRRRAKIPHGVRPNPHGSIEGKAQRYSRGKIVSRDIARFLNHHPEGLGDNFTLPVPSLSEHSWQNGGFQLPAKLCLANGEKVICTKLIQQNRRGNSVLKGCWQDKPVLVKVMQPKKALRNAMREKAGHRILTELEVKTPELYFATPCNERHVVVYEFLYGQSLQNLWETDPQRRAEIADFCIGLLVKLHRNGCRHVDVALHNFMFAEGAFYVIDAHGVRKAPRRIKYGTLFGASKEYGMWQQDNLVRCLARFEPPLYDALMDALKRKYPEAANDPKLEPAIISRAKLRAEHHATGRIRRLFRKAGYLVWREK